MFFMTWDINLWILSLKTEIIPICQVGILFRIYLLIEGCRQWWRRLSIIIRTWSEKMRGDRKTFVTKLTRKKSIVFFLENENIIYYPTSHWSAQTSFVYRWSSLAVQNGCQHGTRHSGKFLQQTFHKPNKHLKVEIGAILLKPWWKQKILSISFDFVNQIPCYRRCRFVRVYDNSNFEFNRLKSF